MGWLIPDTTLPQKVPALSKPPFPSPRAPPCLSLNYPHQSTSTPPGFKPMIELLIIPFPDPAKVPNKQKSYWLEWRELYFYLLHIAIVCIYCQSNNNNCNGEKNAVLPWKNCGRTSAWRKYGYRRFPHSAAGFALEINSFSRRPTLVLWEEIGSCPQIWLLLETLPNSLYSPLLCLAQRWCGVLLATFSHSDHYLLSFKMNTKTTSTSFLCSAFHPLSAFIFFNNKCLLFLQYIWASQEKVNSKVIHSSRPFFDFSSYIPPLPHPGHTPARLWMTLSFGPIWLLPSFLLYVPPSYSAQTLGVSLHTLSSQDPPCCHSLSFFPFSQTIPNCVNPITCCPHSGQNHLTVQVGASTVWWSVPLVGCALAIPLLAAAEASRLLLKAMLTSLLCSALYSKLTPCSKFTPRLPPPPRPRFPPQAQIKSLFKSHLLLTNAFVTSKEENGIEWHEYIKIFIHAELVFRTIFKVLGTQLCKLK